MKGARKCRGFIIIVLMSLLAVVSCSGKTEWTGSQSAGSANVSIFVRDDGDFPYPAGGECVRTISWSFRPVNMRGASGRDAALDMKNRQYRSSVQTGDCYYNESAPDLRAGEWIVEAAGVDAPYASWRTSCTADLKSGDNALYFTMGMPSCSTTKFLTP